MTQEIKDKLEQEATAHKDQFNSCVRGLIPTDDHPYESFIKGVKTILKNPIEWGLCPIDQHAEYFGRLQLQLQKYREALEEIVEICGTANYSAFNQLKEAVTGSMELAEEALKQ